MTDLPTHSGGPSASTPPEQLLRHAQWVRRLARSLVADAHRADDLAQEALVRALERPPERPGPLRGWLATVLRNLAAEGRRGTVRREAREEDTARPESGGDAGDLAARAAAQREVVGAVLGLDEPYRSTLLLRYFEDLGPRRIAARQGVPLNTVRNRLARGRAALRARLDAGRGGERGAWLRALLPLTRPPEGSWAHALPALEHLVPGALLVNAKLLIAGLLVLFVGALAAVGLRNPEPEAVAGPTARDDGFEPAPRAELARAQGQGTAETLSANGRSELAAEPREESPPEAAGTPSVLPDLVGRVVDLNAQPVADVLVVRGDDHEQGVRSASDGRFRMPSGSGKGDLRVADPRWSAVLSGAPVREGSGHEAILLVAPRAPLEGRVVDALSGLPLEGVTLAVEPPVDLRADFSLNLDHSNQVRYRVESDAEGGFALAEAPALPEGRLTAHLGGYLPHAEPLPPAGSSPHVIALSTASDEANRLRGRVEDETGAPVPEARVALGLDVVNCDERGEFVFELDAEASFNRMMRNRGPELVASIEGTLTALAPGSQPGSYTAPRSPEGEVQWPPFVTVRLGPPTLTITGTVVGRDGDPLAGAQVWIADPTFFGALGDARARVGPGLVHVETLVSGSEATTWTTVQTDAEGRFRIEGLSQRNYDVEALDPDTLQRGRLGSVPAGSERLRIELDAEGLFPSLAGRVVDHEGRGVAGVAVRPMCDAFQQRIGGEVVGTSHEMASGTRTDEDGRFALTQVPRDLVYLRLDGPDILPLEWGRRVEGGLGSLVEASADELEIEVSTRCHFQVELADPSEADAFSLLDAEGQELMISEFQGTSRMEAPRQRMVEGRSNPMAVSDRATTLVLYREGEEVRRAPVRLRSGERTVLQP